MPKQYGANFRWSPLDNAEAGRRRAKRDRDNCRGNTCKVYPSIAALDRAQGGAERSPLNVFIAELRWRWSDACTEAKAQYAWDSYQREATGGDYAEI